ncbi:uncharacterized protein LOC125649764 isoform X2 [Ostrea edulis]|uniref:uncharacterized protein LOC125649764 isoform X2 n=1 Tax=Ostrea edulis TaxID=37623 RepID=UPI002094759A|nr:uncharacterized protein LOC125649764 isoform X2 [Ostrea edulis]XP_048733457.1 uncharacterized protein LOC125649764 isoform X2 [Ostrea edulis]XP_056021518.1 uncharacterized protein LOC125649764 isoform X2 [Ostrea edulis]XP_056021519.1 uncharacterized protein LOC125649764 isoform X2 [Ostrea edulis]XP_056021520.1 uncharacterized protein LOC125649764 isoform X2 [Ostrea edulis]
MDWRNIRCCLCWFVCLAAINFLIALLIAYRTLSGECEPEVCYEHGTCLTNKDGYKCQCHHGYTGDQCQFKKHMPPKSLHRNVTNSNHTKHMVTYNPMLNDSAVVVMSTPSTHTREVERQSLRDSGFTSAYWTFIVVYAIASTSIFLFAFFVLNFFQKNMSKQFKGKDYYGIQFKPEGQTEEEIQNQRRHLVSDASGLDMVA